jgi:recombination protein RecR
VTVVERLIRHFSRLPGLGQKSASRIVYFLLKTDRRSCEDLARDILELKTRIEPCRLCGNYTDSQPCVICSDSGRDRKSLCVVEEAKDILSIESIQDYRGLYHVLQGVISPLDGVGPEDLRIPSLLSRIEAEGIEEVILATNPTVEGDTTALYLVDLLRKRLGVKITRLALGLPAGGDLEYADRLTLSRAFRGRSPV